MGYEIDESVPIDVLEVTTLSVGRRGCPGAEFQRGWIDVLFVPMPRDMGS